MAGIAVYLWVPSSTANYPCFRHSTGRAQVSPYPLKREKSRYGSHCDAYSDHCVAQTLTLPRQNRERRRSRDYAGYLTDRLVLLFRRVCPTVGPNLPRYWNYLEDSRAGQYSAGGPRC